MPSPLGYTSFGQTMGTETPLHFQVVLGDACVSPSKGTEEPATAATLAQWSQQPFRKDLL